MICIIPSQESDVTSVLNYAIWIMVDGYFFTDIIIV